MCYGMKVCVCVCSRMRVYMCNLVFKNEGVCMCVCSRMRVYVCVCVQE